MNQNHEPPKNPKNRYLKRMWKKLVFFFFWFCVGVRREGKGEKPQTPQIMNFYRFKEIKRKKKTTQNQKCHH